MPKRQKACTHPLDKRHWRDDNGWMCHMRRDFKRARTWHGYYCGAMLPIGQTLGDYAETLAFAFLGGEFEHVTGGFPTVAFHDGYRNYDERVEAWIHNSSRLDNERSAEKTQEWLDDYAAGAFARQLEKAGWPWH